MGFLTDVQKLKDGLIIFRRADVAHRNWYCRVKVPKQSRYKTFSLKTPDINVAKDKAFDHDADIRFRVKHEVPIFEKSFADVAAEYSAHIKAKADAGQITMLWWEVIDTHVRLHLNPFAGSLQIAHVSEDRWDAYPLWRKKDGKRNHSGKPPSDGTIRLEMVTFRAVMKFAAKKRYIREGQIPTGRLPGDKARREAFTPKEYRKLHTFGRGWIKAGRTAESVWYRTMAYNFMLVMTNTGMRPKEAENLRWRDIEMRRDAQGRAFVCLNVRGKSKFRELVAADKVATYFDRIRRISRASKPDDAVFTTWDGSASKTLYDSLLRDLLEESELLLSSTGRSRTTYSYRHTYATYRLMEGVDVYFLAKQMGTSVKMIEDYYGHITPSTNAGRILQGIPGWEPIEVKPSGALKAA